VRPPRQPEVVVSHEARVSLLGEARP